jgi:hypothetical protein
MLKEHLEFFALDLSVGWETPPGYPEGIEQKILAGSLDEENKKGSRTRLLRFQPGHWEEVFLVSGSLTVGGETFQPYTYACRPPHTPHGPFKSEDGCLLVETHFYEASGQIV